MAKDAYTSEVSPSSFLRADEEEQGLQTNGGYGPAVKKRGRHRLASNGRDKLTLAQMKAHMTAFWKDGETYTEIAEKVNQEFHLEGQDKFNAHNVQYHISALLKSAKAQAMLHIDERQALILARYDQLEMLITEAYFASMAGSSTTNYERQIKMARSKEREKQMLDDLKRERKRVVKENIKRALEHRPLLKPAEPDPIIGDLPELLVKTSENIKEYERMEERPSGDPRFLSMLIDINDKRAKLFHLLNRTDVSNPDQDLAKLPDEERQSRMSAVLHQVMSRKTQDKGSLAVPGPLGGFKEGEEPEPVTQFDKMTEEEVEEIETQVEWEWD